MEIETKEKEGLKEERRGLYRELRLETERDMMRNGIIRGGRESVRETEMEQPYLYPSIIHRQIVYYNVLTTKFNKIFAIWIIKQDYLFPFF